MVAGGPARGRSALLQLKVRARSYLAAAEAAGISLYLTGTRHFAH